MAIDSRRANWLLWYGAGTLETIALALMRSRLEKAHIALAYLLLVLGASARGGRALGLSLAVLTFFLFNFLFLPPYFTFAIQNPLDWLVLVAYLITAAVAAQLLYSAQMQAETARKRADEVGHLSSIGAETLGVARAEDALLAIAEVVRSTLSMDSCEIYYRAEPRAPPRLIASAGANDASHASHAPLGTEDIVSSVAEQGSAIALLDDGTTRVSRIDGADAWQVADAHARAVLVPLRVRDRTVGVLRLDARAGVAPDSAQRRFLDALAYYAALALERVRLVHEARDADVLREADRVKDALLASVSHDLRTPLTTIKALAHDLAAEGDERALAIEEESDRLHRFVEDLLELSRISAGALRITTELNAAEDLLGAALQRVSGTLDGHELRTKLDTSEPLLLGNFDFVHSLRVLVNLIENAIKYSWAGQPIDLEVRRNGSALEFSVADRGPGVPESEAARIYEPFYRSDATGAGSGGVGLGLSIARSLAEAQHGSVTHAPRAGGGTVFIFRVPAAELSSIE